MNKPPILTGTKSDSTQLWTMTPGLRMTGKQETHNVYSLPSIAQTIKFLHTAAGLPMKETWHKAGKAGIYVTWLGGQDSHQKQSTNTSLNQMRQR